MPTLHSPSMARAARRILVTVPKALLEEISTPEALERLERLGETVYNERERENLTEEELRELIRGVDACVTSWGSPRFTARVLENADRLKIIGHAAGSVKPYVTEEVFRRGIIVVSAADAIAVSVAEFALAMILNCLRRIPDFTVAMKGRDWSFRDRRPFQTCDLRGKTVGLIGFGLVARELAELLKPFKVRVLVYDPYALREEVERCGCVPASLEALLRESDVVSIHAALTEETYHMIGERELKMMKKTAVLVNTARGAIVNTDALVKALKERWIAAAALDVFEQEPLPPDHPLYELDNAYLTPHVAGPSDERRRELLGAVVEEFERFFGGMELTRAVKPEELKVRA